MRAWFEKCRECGIMSCWELQPSTMNTNPSTYPTGKMLRFEEEDSLLRNQSNQTLHGDDELTSSDNEGPLGEDLLWQLPWVPAVWT